jgi:hypothetical protein
MPAIEILGLEAEIEKGEFSSWSDEPCRVQIKFQSRFKGEMGIQNVMKI